MVKTIVINNTNVVSGTNNSLFRYTFPTGQVQFDEGSQIAVQSISIPYSWFNISQNQYNNVSFQYTWNLAPTAGTYTVTLPNPSFMTAEDINEYFQSVMIANGHYLINSTGDYVYYMEIVLNTSRYAYQINTYPLPASLPSGWSNPAGVVFGSTNTPFIIITSNSFGKLIGFSSGTYPPAPTTSNYSILSNITPNITPVNSVLMQCNLVNNSLSIPSKLLFGFAPNTTFGSTINITPSEFAYNDIQQGYFSSIDIQFTDENNNNLVINDSNLVVQLVIRKKNEIGY